MRPTPEELKDLRENQETWYDGDHWPPSGYELAQPLFAEIDGLQEEIANLKSDRVLTCVYCGQAYPPGTPAHGAEVLTAHIKTCPKHPMGVLQRENETLKEMIDQLRMMVECDVLPGEVQDRMLRVIHQGEVPA